MNARTNDPSLTASDHILSRNPDIGFAVEFMTRADIDVDGVVTQILENSLQDLSELRRDLERTNRKGIYDVREHRATANLEGFEGTVGYENLVDIITELKDGIALRRVQLMNESFDREGVAL